MSYIMGKANLPRPKFRGLLLKTGQTDQKSSELDDGYYERGIAAAYQILETGHQAGTTTIDLPHLISDTGAFVAATHTYTDAGKCGVFKAAGGETIVITGSALNNGVFTTASATANAVVVTGAPLDFVNEADAPETTFAKREDIANTCVLDLNTGLTWLQTWPKKMGILGAGKMPWTGKIYDIFQFCAYANAAKLAGFDDWRIPNLHELISIYLLPLEVRNATAFPTSPTSYIWSSTFGMECQ